MKAPPLSTVSNWSRCLVSWSSRLRRWTRHKITILKRNGKKTRQQHIKLLVKLEQHQKHWRDVSRYDRSWNRDPKHLRTDHGGPSARPITYTCRLNVQKDQVSPHSGQRLTLHDMTILSSSSATLPTFFSFHSVKPKTEIRNTLQSLHEQKQQKTSHSLSNTISKC